MAEVTARIVRSDGQEMTLGTGTPWRIPNDGLSNWATLTYNVSAVEIPSYDGALVTDQRVASQDRSITAVSRQIGDNPQLRAEAIAFFSPKHTYTVHMTYMGRTRWVEGVQIGFSASEGNVYKPVTIVWSILCANPFLRSEYDFGKDIAEVIPMFGFPWVSFFPESEGSMPGTNTGAVVSAFAFAKDVEITNGGDVPVGVRAYIRARGKVVNPSMRLGDGWVRVLVEMNDGDELYVDAQSRPPVVRLNDENAMNRVDRNSSILNLMLGVGETTLEYDADDGDQNMSVSVYYNTEFLGV